MVNKYRYERVLQSKAFFGRLRIRIRLLLLALALFVTIFFFVFHHDWRSLEVFLFNKKKYIFLVETVHEEAVLQPRYIPGQKVHKSQNISTSINT